MCKTFKISGKDWAVIAIVLIAFYLQHLLSFRLGINFEEGRDGNAYYLAMQGYKPYRDFEWVYGPFSFLIYPFIMKVFGINLVVIRLSYIIFCSLVIPLTYFLSRKIMPPLWSGMATFLAINLFDVPYYTFNHIFAVLGELGCLLLVINAIKTEKYRINFCIAGIFTTIVLLTKPFFSGIFLLSSIFLFIIILKVKKWLPTRFAQSMILFFGLIFSIAALLVYFYLGVAVKSYFLESIPLFSPNPVGSLYNAGGTSLLTVITRFYERFVSLFALNKLLGVASITDLKKEAVVWFDNFIFCLPFLVPVAILAVHNRFAQKNIEIQNAFKNHKIEILLFVIFSVLISAENLTVAHRMSRAFNIQITFVLLLFFCYLLLKLFSKKLRPFGFCLIIFFVVFLSFLHYFRYPLSRSKKFTEALNLERAKGVLVTPSEKQLYEPLFAYLFNNLSENEQIVILGYNPQFAFLTGQNNLFVNKEGIFLKLENLTRLSVRDKRMLLKLRLLEDEIVKAMELEKPKMVLDIVFVGSRPLYNNSVGNYIKKRYALKETFGPAEMQGIKDDSTGIGRVDVYIRGE